MRKVNVSVGRRTYRCEMPQTEDEMRYGLAKRDFLPPDEGMLFDFTGGSVAPQMWMKDTLVPLDMIGISADGEVLQVERPKPESLDLIPFPGCAWVLEVNKGSRVKVGDEFEIDEDADLDKYVMKVLAPDGTAQALLQGGERIFSRASTRILVSRAKKAYANRKDKAQYEKDCRRLGLAAFKELYAQDHREKEYVELPSK